MARIIAAIIGLIYTAWRHRRGLIIRVMDSSLYVWGMRWIVPRVRFNFHQRLPEWQIEQAYELLEAGDIILTADRWKLTNICIPGDVTHAAMKMDDFRIAQMVCSGFEWIGFGQACQATRVVIIRCKDWDASYAQQVVERCKSFEGTPYDPQFEGGNGLLFCSEMVCEADFEGRLQVNTEDLLGLGRPYVSPMGLYKAGNVEVVWDSDLETK